MTNQNVVVNKDLISGWVTYDDNMNATLDESKVKEWLREFGKTYDTVGTTRSITTPGGSVSPSWVIPAQHRFVISRQPTIIFNVLFTFIPTHVLLYAHYRLLLSSYPVRL